MNSKRGQLTIIIIIAVIIVALGLLTYFLWPKISSALMSQDQASRVLSSQIEPLRQAVSDCVEEASIPAFEKMGLNSGYYDTTGLSTFYSTGKNFIVVMYKDASKQRINKLPALNQIEEQYQVFLETEGNSQIDKCLNNFASFKRNMYIEVSPRIITPLIYNDVVVLSVDWPMKLSKKTISDEAVQNINQKQVMLLIPLGYMWQTANKIVDCETQVDCTYEGIAWDQDNWNNPFRLQYITKEARNLNKDQVVFILESIPYRPNELPYQFNFAIDRT